MGKWSRFLTLGFLVGVIALRPAQTAAATPTDENATRTGTAPAEQAPDDVLAKLSGLIHAGKYAEAQQLTAGLLLAYPEDQRLIKAKTLLDKVISSSKAPKTAATSNQPLNGAAPPTTDTNAAHLTGMEKVEYNSLIELARQAQQMTDLEQQKTLLQKFMAESGPFMVKHPDEMLLWQLRAVSALSLNDPIAGYEAGQRLLAAGAADSNDPKLQHLIAQLNLEGWLDKKIAEIKVQEKRFASLLGTWNVNWDWWFGPNPRDQEEFVMSDSGIEGYVIGEDGVRNTEPDLRGEILDSGEIRWECFLPPSDTGEHYVFRYIGGNVNWGGPKLTVGRRTDPHGYSGHGTIDTAGQQFYPSGWQPVISYQFDKDKEAIKMVVLTQEADPQSTFSKKHPVTLVFRKANSAQDEQVQARQPAH